MGGTFDLLSPDLYFPLRTTSEGRLLPCRAAPRLNMSAFTKCELSGGCVVCQNALFLVVSLVTLAWQHMLQSLGFVF